MEFHAQAVNLKDGRAAVLRSPLAQDAGEMVRYLQAMAAGTEYMTRYPEEVDADAARRAAGLADAARDPRRAFLGCFAQGRLVGNLGLYPVGETLRTRHRCELGQIGRAHV